MAASLSTAPSFVLKAEELAALNYLERGHPRPLALQWINRGTDQHLRPTTIALLMRTLFRETWSPSVRKLHETAGLRVSFANERDRDAFSRQFARARAIERQRQRSELTAVFSRPAAAERGFRELADAGVNPRAVSILWRAGQFLRSNHDSPPGHSKLSVAAASAGGGLAGAIFGVTLLAVPGLGQVAVGGALLAHIGTIGAFGGAVGASGGGLARMLTDFDVDDREIPYFEMAIKRGKVFLAVDPATCGRPIDTVREILERCGGSFASRREPADVESALLAEAAGTAA
jgi:hypothetical protein